MLEPESLAITLMYVPTSRHIDAQIGGWSAIPCRCYFDELRRVAPLREPSPGAQLAMTYRKAHAELRPEKTDPRASRAADARRARTKEWSSPAGFPASAD